jgi:hypothetical protein
VSTFVIYIIENRAGNLSGQYAAVIYKELIDFKTGARNRTRGLSPL